MIQHGLTEKVYASKLHAVSATVREYLKVRGNKSGVHHAVN